MEKNRTVVDQRWLVALGVLLLVFAAWKRFVLVKNPIGSFDEGVLLTNSDLVLRGQVIFRDFYSIYPPGIYYLIAGLWSLTGVSTITFRRTAASKALCRRIFPEYARFEEQLGGRDYAAAVSPLVLVPPLSF